MIEALFYTKTITDISKCPKIEHRCQGVYIANHLPFGSSSCFLARFCFFFLSKNAKALSKKAPPAHCTNKLKQNISGKGFPLPPPTHTHTQAEEDCSQNWYHERVREHLQALETQCIGDRFRSTYINKIPMHQLNLSSQPNILSTCHLDSIIKKASILWNSSKIIFSNMSRIRYIHPTQNNPSLNKWYPEVKNAD